MVRRIALPRDKTGHTLVLKRVGWDCYTRKVQRDERIPSDIRRARAGEELRELEDRHSFLRGQLYDLSSQTCIRSDSQGHVHSYVGPAERQSGVI
ncbi:hypothetical protein AVEN_102353-1 [Araneus ventricosus]|uniref:Uncharacterized protein n=1 Tax=Araneus ventricosus TaxID=182803 RepID=A0A4Y2U519_ARAVE|nr:hypothetical protein AVEN_102353-1 [Araneus ventricosus]